MAKLSPASGGITLTTVVAGYLEVNWFLIFIIMLSLFGTAMAVFYFSGLFKAEQRYVIGELGMGDSKSRTDKRRKKIGV
jgi:hypothetical protein